jgi:polyisoprenoid-binding protein YceI
VFDAAEYPVIRFSSFAVERIGAGTAEIHGLLTARGKSREETFVATVTDLKPGRITLHVTGSVYRAPFGMDVGVPIYSNSVQFDMILYGRRA